MQRSDSGVTVHAQSGARHFDAVVFACHADQALRLLDAPTAREHSVLGAFRYQPNRAVLHSDIALMPRRRSVWSSWNYLAETPGARLADPRVSVSYWMNRLQGLDAGRDYLVSLNPLREPAPSLVHAEFE